MLSDLPKVAVNMVKLEIQIRSLTTGSLALPPCTVHALKALNNAALYTENKGTVTSH